MEEISSTPIQSELQCMSCSVHVPDTDPFCNSCGYPLKGTEMEQQTFITTRTNKAIDLEEFNKKIKQASFALYYIAGSTVIMGFIFSSTTHDPSEKKALLIINFILAIIYVCLGVWSKKKPLAAIISGFSLYIIILLIKAFTHPMSIFSGIFIKILFIGYFIKGIKSALEIEKLKKELNIE